MDGEPVVLRKIVQVYAVVLLWLGTSAAVILYNKWILAYGGFPYPVTLTMWHMCFCSILAHLTVPLAVRSSAVPAISIDTDTYLRAIAPIGACYALSLWVGNAAFLYLSVSFRQMFNALMPGTVFTVGCMFGVERLSWLNIINVVVVAAGMAVASFGEVEFNLTGVCFQLVCVFSESVRLVLVQILLQAPFFFLEWPKLSVDPKVNFSPFMLGSSAIAAFGLNLASLLLIGNTSALSMNVAGVVKDWLLIGLSVLIFKNTVSKLNLLGYCIAFLAVCWYNWRKLCKVSQAIQASSTVAQQAGSKNALSESMTFTQGDGT